MCGAASLLATELRAAGSRDRGSTDATDPPAVLQSEPCTPGAPLAQRGLARRIGVERRQWGSRGRRPRPSAHARGVPARGAPRPGGWHRAARPARPASGAGSPTTALEREALGASSDAPSPGDLGAEDRGLAAGASEKSSPSWVTRLCSTPPSVWSNAACLPGGVALRVHERPQPAAGPTPRLFELGERPGVAARRARTRAGRMSASRSCSVDWLLGQCREPALRVGELLHVRVVGPYSSGTPTKPPIEPGEEATSVERATGSGWRPRKRPWLDPQAQAQGAGRAAWARLGGGCQARRRACSSAPRARPRTVPSVHQPHQQHRQQAK